MVISSQKKPEKSDIIKPQNKNTGRARKGAVNCNGKGDTLFVYCYSDSRSSQATAMLKRMGYTNVKNIGGIAGYIKKSPSAIIHPKADFFVISSHRPCKFKTIFPT